MCTKFQLSSMIKRESRIPCPWSHTWRTLKVPDWSLGWWGHSWVNGLSWYVIFDLCAKFQLSSMNRSVSRTPILEVILGGRWRFLIGYLEDQVILDIMDRHDMWFLICVPNFSSLAWIEVCQEPPFLEVILWGHWRFLTGDLEDGVILDVLGHLGRPPGTNPESFVKIWLHLADLWGVEILARTDGRTHARTDGQSHL